MVKEVNTKIRRKDILPEYHEQIMLNETSKVQEQNIFNKQFEELASNLCYNYESLKQITFQVTELSKSFSSANFFKKGKVAATASDETSLQKCPGLMPQTHAMKKSDTFTTDFKLAPPADLLIAGSFGQQTLLRHNGAAVDLIMALPESIMPENPHLNYRYIFRRAAYLACVARALETQKLATDLRVEYLNANRMKPVLNFQLADCPIRINLIPAFAGFSESRLKGQNNVQPLFVDESFDVTPLRGKAYPETAWYNASLVEESKLLSEEQPTFDQAINDCIAVFKHWASLKMLTPYISGTIINRLFLLALQHEAIVENSSSVAVFRGIINFIASKVEREHLIDDDFDLLFNAPAGTFESLKTHASSTHESLHINSPAVTKYMDAFHRVVPTTFADILIEMTGFKNPSSYEDKYVLPQYMVDTKGASQILKKAFTDRYTSITYFVKQKSGTKVSKEPSYEYSLSAAISLAHGAFNPVTIGPSTENDCAEFLTFWPADLPEQRKFKDGRIMWTLVWNKKGEFSHATPFKILKALIPHHFEESHVPSAIDKSFKQLNNDDKVVSETLVKLSKSLYDLKDVPLSIVSTRAISPSYAGVSPTYLTTEGMATDAVDVLVELIPSRAWPEEEDFAATLKTLIIAKMASSLTTQFHYQTCVRPYCLDVVVDGLTFRLWMVTKIAPESIYAQMSSLYGELRALSQKHISFAHGAQLCKIWANAHLFSNQPLSASILETMDTVPGFEATSFDGSFFSSEFIDIIVASLFTNPAPYTQAPLTATAVLSRFLERLATWPWDFAPLVCNLDMAPEQKALLMEKYNQLRQDCSACVAFNHSDILNLDTQRLPAEILQNMISYAEFCLKNFSKGVKSIMKTPLAQYDGILYLNEANEIHGRDYAPIEMEGRLIENDAVIDLFDLPESANFRALPYKFVNFSVVRDLVGVLNDQFGYFASFHADLYAGIIIAVKLFDHVKIPVTSTAGSMFRDSDGNFVIDEFFGAIRFVCNQLLTENAIKIKQE